MTGKERVCSGDAAGESISFVAYYIGGCEASKANKQLPRQTETQSLDTMTSFVKANIPRCRLTVCLSVCVTLSPSLSSLSPPSLLSPHYLPYLPTLSFLSSISPPLSSLSPPLFYSICLYVCLSVCVTLFRCLSLSLPFLSPIFPPSPLFSTSLSLSPLSLFSPLSPRPVSFLSPSLSPPLSSLSPHLSYSVRLPLSFSHSLSNSPFLPFFLDVCLFLAFFSFSIFVCLSIYHCFLLCLPVCIWVSLM